MQNISDLGLTPPFHVKQTAVYPLIVDSRGVSVAFVCMSEHMDKIARLIAESLEGAAGSTPLQSSNTRTPLMQAQIFE